MKAVRLVEPGLLELWEAPPPTPPGPGEALVRIRSVGVCGTDLHAFQGHQPFFTYPRVLGHELGVEVQSVGAGVTNVRPGDRCSVEPYLSCGRCIACRRGKPNCCTALRVLGVHTDGGMREALTLPAANLHCSERLTLEQLALVETLAIGSHAVARAGLERGETVLVCGAGPIGLSVMQFASAAGARVIALDVNAARLEFCARQLGAAEKVNPRDGDVSAALGAICGGELPTAVFDATGNAVSMAASFNFAAAGGRLVFVGLFQGEVSFNDPQFHRRELTLLSSRNALSGDFQRIIRLVEEGVIDTRPWITHRAVLSEVPGTFASWTRPESAVVKAMVEV